MSTYRVDEVSFELPDGFEDRSLNVFHGRPSHGGILSITIAREPKREGLLSEQAAGSIASLRASLPSIRVIARRDTEIGYLPAVEARLHATHDGVPIYQRQAYIEWFDRVLLVSATSTRQESARCDALAGAISESFRFRKPRG